MCLSRQGGNPFRSIIMMSEDKKLKAYELAIQARAELKKDYNTWMNFFYVFNGALLVAVTTFSKENNEKAVLFLSLIGVLASIIWHFSCRGYRYWIDSWTRVVIKREKEYFGERMVFGVLAEEVKESRKPLGKNNISTSKLTQVISIIIIFCWNIFMTYSLYIFLKLDKLGLELLHKKEGLMLLLLVLLIIKWLATRNQVILILAIVLILALASVSVLVLAPVLVVIILNSIAMRILEEYCKSDLSMHKLISTEIKE